MLQVLSLQGNGLEQLPARGAYLGSLQALDCSTNFLPTGVPSYLQQAPALQLLIWREEERYVACRCGVVVERVHLCAWPLRCQHGQCTA